MWASVITSTPAFYTWQQIQTSASLLAATTAILTTQNTGNLCKERMVPHGGSGAQLPAPRYLAETLQLTTSRSSCRRLRSAATSTLIIPATWRRTLGDRAFPVAAARAWNWTVRNEQSLAAFRQQPKTVLFRTSFGEDANIWAASLSTRDCFSLC